jgi:hypothetical protein
MVISFFTKGNRQNPKVIVLKKMVNPFLPWEKQFFLKGKIFLPKDFFFFLKRIA